MKTGNNHFKTFAAVEQVTNNTTNWIGHRTSNDKGRITGQTFISPGDGDLQAIEIFPAAVTRPGKIIMTLHHFDLHQKSWGPALGSSTIDINTKEAGKWLAFDMKGMHLDKGKAYGFRLQSPDTYIGVGEAAGSHQKPPFGEGKEWQFTEGKAEGRAFSYFSLAFKVDMRA